MNGRCGSLLAIALAAALVCAACHSEVSSETPASESVSPSASPSPTPTKLETKSNAKVNGSMMAKPAPTTEQNLIRDFLWYAPTCNLESRVELDNKSKIDFLFNMSYWLSKNHVIANRQDVPRHFWPEKLSEPNLYAMSTSQLQAILHDYLGLTIDEAAMKRADLIDDEGKHVLSLGDGPDDWAIDHYPEIAANGEVVIDGASDTGMDVKVPVYRCNGGMASDRLLDAWVAPNKDSAFGYTLLMLETKPLLTHLTASVTLSANDGRHTGPENLVDMDDGTCWGAPGNGVGAELNFEFAQAIWIDTLSIQPGDASSVAAFRAGRQVKAVRLTFSDGSTIELEIPSMEPMLGEVGTDESRALSSIMALHVPLPYPVKTDRIDLTILQTTQQKESAPDQTMIGGIDFFGNKRPHGA